MERRRFPHQSPGIRDFLATVLTLALTVATTGQEPAPESHQDGAPSTEEEIALPQLAEVRAVIREHLPEISAEDLDRAALQGILTEFQSDLELIAQDEPPTESEASSAPALTRYYESSIGYIAAPMINATTPNALREAFVRLDSENILKGLVLDLRHVSGSDFAPVLEIVGFLGAPEGPALDWGGGVQSVPASDQRVNVPLIALIDQTTRGPGEAAAALIRQAKLGILVGEPTAGQAHRYQSVPLTTGQTLRLATGFITLSDGTQLSQQGVRPDIAASADAPALSTGDSSEDELDEGQPLPVPQDDPVLARALELLKGIGIVERRKRS